MGVFECEGPCRCVSVPQRFAERYVLPLSWHVRLDRHRGELYQDAAKREHCRLCDFDLVSRLCANLLFRRI
jgi:hypothetical protein